MTSCGLRRRGYATRQAGELQRTLAKAQAERQRAILAALQDVAQVLERQVWTPHEASVLGQLQEVAGTELKAIQLCAGDAQT